MGAQPPNQDGLLTPAEVAVVAGAVVVAVVVSAADMAIESEVARTARALPTVASSAARDAAADVTRVARP